jgi:hypothetical protein
MSLHPKCSLVQGTPVGFTALPSHQIPAEWPPSPRLVIKGEGMWAGLGYKAGLGEFLTVFFSFRALFVRALVSRVLFSLLNTFFVAPLFVIGKRLSFREHLFSIVKSCSINAQWLLMFSGFSSLILSLNCS